MAEKSTDTTKKTTARKPAASRKPAEAKSVPEEKAPAPAPVQKRTFRPDEYVTVINGFDGRLVYKSTKTGEKFVFDAFGSTHEMEIQELKKAKSDSKKFFEKNWFLIDDPEVIEYLGVGEYYKDALTYAEFDQIADMTADEISARMAKVSDGQKIAIAHYARKLIKGGKIDSMKAITALEKGLGVQLTDK